MEKPSCAQPRRAREPLTSAEYKTPDVQVLQVSSDDDEYQMTHCFPPRTTSLPISQPPPPLPFSAYPHHHPPSNRPHPHITPPTASLPLCVITTGHCHCQNDFSFRNVSLTSVTYLWQMSNCKRRKGVEKFLLSF